MTGSFQQSQGEMSQMRTRIIVLALGTFWHRPRTPSPAGSGSLQGGYSVSTSTAANFPSGGSFGSSAFIGRQLSPLFTLGAEGGFYGVENTTTEARVDCPPPSVPGSLGCNETDRAELDWIQLGATLRVGPNKGGFRPYGALGVGVYFGQRDTESTIADPSTGTVYPGFPLSSQCGPDGRGREHWRRTRLGAEQQQCLEPRPLGPAAFAHGRRPERRIRRGYLRDAAGGGGVPLVKAVSDSRQATGSRHAAPAHSRYCSTVDSRSLSPPASTA